MIKAKTREARILHRLRPIRECFKLNADGCSLGNSGTSGEGAVIDKGHMVAAFSKTCGEGTNTKAEVLGIFDGLKLCNRLGLEKVEVESDSKVGAEWLWPSYHSMVSNSFLRSRF